MIDSIPQLDLKVAVEHILSSEYSTEELNDYYTIVYSSTGSCGLQSDSELPNQT